eukprot:3798806-Karenia_brevis.AAC.1
MNTFLNRYAAICLRDEESVFDVNLENEAINEAMHRAVNQCVPSISTRAHRPWISYQTLQLIAQRNEARHKKRYGEEKNLNCQIKRAAREDRPSWLNDMVAFGSWDGGRGIC